MSDLSRGYRSDDERLADETDGRQGGHTGRITNETDADGRSVRVLQADPHESIILTPKDLGGDGAPPLVVRGDEHNRFVLRHGTGRPGSTLIAEGEPSLAAGDANVSIVLRGGTVATVPQCAGLEAHDHANVLIGGSGFPATVDGHALASITGDGREGKPVVCRGDSRAVAFDAPDLVLEGRATAAVFHGGHVTMSGSSRADLYDEVSAEMRDDAKARISDNVTVDAYGRAVVEKGGMLDRKEPLVGRDRLPRKMGRGHGARPAKPENVALHDQARADKGLTGRNGRSKGSTAARILARTPSADTGREVEAGR